MEARRCWPWVAAAAAIVAVWTGTVAADAKCFSTHTGGKAATYFSFCISDHGNVVQFQSPEGYWNIGVEGYALCGLFEESRYDSGLHESGFGASTITQPNGRNTLPLMITRETTDGHFRLTQRFARDTTETDLTIAMTLTNISGAQRSLVSLVRYFSGVSPQWWWYARSADSVWATIWGSARTRGVRLTALTPVVSHTTAVEAFADWAPPDGTASGCFTDLAATPTLPGDFVGRISYGWKAIEAGASRTAAFVYRRF